MRALDTKLVRDLWRTKGQVFTITLVLASGIASYICLSGTYRAIAASRDAYYARHELPDAFVHLERAPRSVGDRLRDLPGVASVRLRLVEPVTFRFAGTTRPPSGTAISVEPGALPRDLALREGRMIEPGRDDEALVLETFAVAHGLHPGDPLELVLGGKAHRLRIAGLVLSPEYVFPAAVGGGSFEQFGVVWLDEDALAAASGKVGAFDDATFRLARGASLPDVLAGIDRVLAPWGGGGAIERAKQPSNKVVHDEIAQLEVLATQVPIVFLIVAAFLLNVVLSRMVHLQREQLAVLRALGYSRLALARHVLWYATVIGAAGLAIGLALGAWLQRGILTIYGQFFHFPVLEAAVDRDLLLASIVVAAGAAGTGAITAVWRVTRLAPAEAMRPPIPASYRRGLLSRLGLARLAGPMGRMVVRDLERRPIANGLSVVGIAFSLALVVLGRFSVDSVDHLLDVILARTMREDVAVYLVRPVPRDDLGWFRHAPGVLAVEPMRMVPVRIHAGDRRYDTSLQAYAQDGRLRQVLDEDSRPVPLPAEGVMLTDLLGERLGVRAGDRVTIERREGDHGTFEVPVASLVHDHMGMNVYMELDALSRVLHEQPSASGALLEVDPAERDALLRALDDVPAVVMVSEPRAFRETYEAQSGNMMLVWTLIVVLFGSVIAVGVVYNTARIGLSERARDLATLRVLGFTRDEVASVMRGQLVVQVALAIPLGMLCGLGLATLLMSSADPEAYRFVIKISPATYAFASLVVIGSAIAAALVVRRKLDRTDIVSALKARD